MRDLVAGVEDDRCRQVATAKDAVEVAKAGLADLRATVSGYIEGRLRATQRIADNTLVRSIHDMCSAERPDNNTHAWRVDKMSQRN